MTFLEHVAFLAYEHPWNTLGILAITGAAIWAWVKDTALKWLKEDALKLIRGQYEKSLEIRGQGPFYLAFLKWMDSEENTIMWRREVYDGDSHWDHQEDPEGIGPGQQVLNIEVKFGAGSKFLCKYLGKPILVSFGKEEENKTTYRRFYITSFFHSMEQLADFVNEISRFHKEDKQDDNEISVYRMSSARGWDHQYIRKKPLGSLILEKEVLGEVERAFDQFRSSHSKYIMAGAPYRMGCLFYGQPGNGKTSMVQFLAGKYKMPIYQIPIGSKMLDDEKLETLISSVNWNSIVLLEDIDAADCSHSRMDEKKSSGHPMFEGVTLTGLLNVLDGVGSREGIIFIMTSNHPEKLDGALLRDGRTDVKILIDNATRKQAKMMFLKFFPGKNDSAERFSELFTDGEESMAAIQGHLIQNWTLGAERAVDEAARKFEQSGTIADLIYGFKTKSALHSKREKEDDDDDDDDSDDSFEDDEDDGIEPVNPFPKEQIITNLIMRAAARMPKGLGNEIMSDDDYKKHMTADELSVYERLMEEESEWYANQGLKAESDE